MADSVIEEQQRLNRELSLLAQVETATALARVEELAAVPGVDIFIGPSDLAASLGVPGQTNHQKVLTGGRTHHRDGAQARQESGDSVRAADYIHWARLGVDLLFCTNDIVCLKRGAQEALKAAAEAIAQAEEEREIISSRLESVQ